MTSAYPGPYARSFLATKSRLSPNVDCNLEYQQNFSGLTTAVVVVDTPSNDIEVLRPLMPKVREALQRVRPGIVTHVPA